MAKRVITNTIWEDDLTGEPVDEGSLLTKRFTIDGTQYEIDLGEESAAKFLADMDPWTHAARRIGGKKQAGGSNGTTTTASSTSKSNNRQIRDWARTNGIDVPDRGRISQEVREQFEAAQG